MCSVISYHKNLYEGLKGLKEAAQNLLEETNGATQDHPGDVEGAFLP